MYLLRHGATENNVANPPRLQGRGSNLPLSAVGLSQAARTAGVLRDRSIAAIYSSPLLRATQTADALAAALGLGIEIVEAITEVDAGSWEGRDWEEIARSEPEAFHRFMDDPGRWPYAGGESMGEVTHRIVPAFEALWAQHSGQSIAVVAHNAVNRCYLSHVLGLPVARSRTLIQENCCVNVLRRSGDKVSVLTLNAALHI
jgi:broad specificity phosphatase PhoE